MIRAEILLNAFKLLDQIVHCYCYCTVLAHILQGAIGYQQPLALIHSRKAWRSKSHVFLPKCQGQSVPCQTNMENKPEELQLCLKTRDSFEAILAHKPWPHLSVSCYGELDAWTHINTNACTTTNSLMTNLSDCMMAGSEAGRMGYFIFK